MSYLDSLMAQLAAEEGDGQDALPLGYGDGFEAAPSPYVYQPAPRVPTVNGFGDQLAIAALKGGVPSVPMTRRRGQPSGALPALLAGGLRSFAAVRGQQISEREKLNDILGQYAHDQNVANLRATLEAGRRKQTVTTGKKEPADLVTEDDAKRNPAYRPYIGWRRTEATSAISATKPGATPKPESERLVQVMGSNGVPTWVRESAAVGKPAAQAARAVTGQERQALAYYNRGKQALDTIEAPGADGRSLEQRVGTSIASQTGLKFLPNMLKSPDAQAYRQAQRAFTEARLRKESGAAIPVHEYENDDKTYFAQPGDSPETVERKRIARSVVLNGLAYSAGRAYEEFYGEPMPTQQAKKKVRWSLDKNGRLVQQK